MKLKTSFSELTPLKKDITRFAPVWVLYLVGMVLVLPGEFNMVEITHRATNLPDLISSFGVVNLLYACLCAQLLFGDLYNTKLCYSLHALPQRREGWLLSHFAAALLFSLVPNLLICLLLMAQLGSLGYLVLYALLAIELQFLFFFGLATVSVMVTGNRLAMPLVYGGLNFVSILAWWILNTIYLPVLPGVELDMAPFSRICPVAELFNFDYMEFRREEVYDKHGMYLDAIYHYEGLADGWGYLAVLGVLGLLLMGLAVLLYRWRHLESAGDFVAFGKLKVPMLVVMTVCVGGVAAFMGEELFGSSLVVWLIVGIVVGYFGGMMLLERRVKIFRVKSCIGFAVLAAVLVVSYVMISADVFGIVRWTPEPEQVESVTIANFNNTNSSYDDYYFGNRISVKLEEPEEIRDIIRAHEDIIDTLEDEGYPVNGRHRVVITYRLESGRTVKRNYSAPAQGTNYEIISRYFYTPERILGYTDWEEYLQKVYYVDIGGNEIAPQHHEAVLEALRADCEDGHVKLSNMVDDKTYTYAYIRGDGMGRELAIGADAEHTRALMCQPEIVLGYSDWEAFLAQDLKLTVSGEEVKLAHYAGLLEAVKADCEAGRFNLLEENTAMWYLEISTNDNYRSLVIPSGATETIAYLQAYVFG